jgi:hypothetical protein
VTLITYLPKKKKKKKRKYECITKIPVSRFPYFLPLHLLLLLVHLKRLKFSLKKGGGELKEIKLKLDSSALL